MSIQSIIPLVETLIYIILFGVILVNRPWQRQHKYFIVYLAVALVWGISEFFLTSNFLPEYKSPMFKIVICSSVLWVVQLYLFARSFLRLPMGIGLWIGYASFLALTLLAVLGIAPPAIIVEEGVFKAPEYGWWFAVYIGPLVFLAALGTRSLVSRLKVLTDPRERNRVFYLFFAGAILILFGFIGVTPAARAVGLPLSHVGGLVSAVVLAYAILKHGLVSINTLLQRGLGWALLFVVGVGSYVFILYLLHFAFDFELTTQALVLATFSAALVAILVYWLRPFFVTMVGYFFYRDTFTYRQMILRFDRDIGNIISLDELADKMLVLVVRALQVSKIHLIIRNQSNNDYVAQYVYPKVRRNQVNNLKFVSDNPIIRWLEKESYPLNLSQIDSNSLFNGLWQMEREELDSSGIEVLCPIKNRGELIGILGLGKKRTSSAYSHEDIELLISIAGKAGIIIENARMFETLKQQQYQMQHLLSEAIHAQENERKRISADLHDSVAQWLAGASYQAQTVEALLERNNDKLVHDELVTVENTIEKSLKELRRVVVDMRPPSLDELGLNHSLRQSLMALSSDGISCVFNEKGIQVRLLPSIEITVYRVVQEAMNNIRKHAKATRVELDLEYRDDNLVVKVLDNGTGFDLTSTIDNAISVGNLGLLGMKQRVEMLGGNIDIVTRNGRGTQIIMTLPIQTAEAKEEI